MHLSQAQLAISQLEDAVALFLDERSYASSTTLAGAAEEILGKLLESKGIENVLEWQWGMAKVIYELFEDGTDERKTFNDESNRAKIVLKHFVEDGIESIDWEDAAVKMIIRANENAARLKLTISRIDEFEQWYLVNYVG